MKIIQYFFLFFVFSIVYGCSNGTDVSSLCFEKEYYEKPLLENPSEIMFSGGSNNLSVEVSDDNVLEATIDAGKIKIKTKKNGIVYLVVKDKTENTSVTIRVKVVDSYLGLQLGKPIPNYSVYNEDDRLYLVNNKSKSYLLYSQNMQEFFCQYSSYHMLIYISIQYYACVILFFFPSPHSKYGQHKIVNRVEHDDDLYRNHDKVKKIIHLRPPPLSV